MIVEPLFSSLVAILKAVLTLFDLKPADIATPLVQLIRRMRAPGLYEVLEHEVTLELQDEAGAVAVYQKRQKVRFLQDNIIAYQDQAWGDGNIFASYSCSPGVPVDRYRDGHRYRILISLRHTKRRNDVTEFRMERTITDGFKKSVDSWQTEIDHRTRSVVIHIIFPASRPPQSVILIEQNISRSTLLSTECFQRLPDGRVQVTWETKHPRIFEAYVMRWVW